jgi:phosphopantothenoylcysteine decarboxylase
MAKVLLGVTGSVAAIRTPALYDELVRAGHSVKVVATQASLYFFDPSAVGRVAGHDAERDPEKVILDEDEWFRRGSGERYQRDDPVRHIELRRWAELLLIAPLDANTLAKLAHGLADNCLTCVWRAWDRTRPILLAPAMNTLMWEHPLTAQHLRLLALATGIESIPTGLDLDSMLQRINDGTDPLRIIGPQAKRLACGDVGMGGLADVDTIAAAVVEQLTLAGSAHDE